MRYLAALLLAATLSWPAVAEGPPTMGPLAPYIELDSQDGPWRLSEQDGALVFENDGDANAVTYRYVQPQQRPLSVSVETTATGSGTGLSGAGLLYALQGEGAGRLYYLFLLQADGTTSVFRRDQSGVNRMLATKRDDLDTSQPVELGIEETTEGATFTVNGERMGTIGARGVGSGAVGIAAVGQGRFAFEDFRVGAAGG